MKCHIIAISYLPRDHLSMIYCQETGRKQESSESLKKKYIYICTHTHIYISYIYICKNILILSLPNIIKHLIYIQPLLMFKLHHSLESLPKKTDVWLYIYFLWILLSGRMCWLIDTRVWFFCQYCYLYSLLAIDHKSHLYKLESIPELHVTTISACTFW